MSVIIPLYNREQYIKQAIQSILKQTYTDFELLILDDGSSDKSCEVVSSFSDPRIQLHKNPTNKGISFTRNRLNQLTSGEYIAVLDSDDLAEEDRLEKQVDYLDRHPEVDLVSGRAKLINETGKPTGSIWGGKLSPEQVFAFLPLGNQIIHSTVMARSSFFLKFPFDESLKTAEDYDVWLRGNNECKYEVLGDILSSYRIHKESISIEQEEGIKRNNSYVRLQYYKNSLHINTEEWKLNGLLDRHPNPIFDLDEGYRIIHSIYHKSPKKESGFEAEWKKTWSNIWYKCLFRVSIFERSYIKYTFGPLSLSIPLKDKLVFIIKCLLNVRNQLVRK